jgi:hypothetical protein
MAEHQRVPNLEELDEKEAYSFLTDVFFYGPIPDPEVVYEANHPDDYAMEMPQSGERIRGRENMRRFHKAYPGSPTKRNVVGASLAFKERRVGTHVATCDLDAHLSCYCGAGNGTCCAEQDRNL